MQSRLKRLLSSPRALRAALGRGRPRLLVLMYHDLREDDDFPNWLRVGVSAFDRQLAFLREIGDIVDPAACADPDALPADRLHFVLTFDDGYVNNLRLALPVLARHRVPAVFFVSTGHMQDQQPFWSDEVVTAIEGAGLADLDLGDFGLGRFAFRAGPPDARWDDIQRLLAALKEQGNEDDPKVAAVLAHLRRRQAGALDTHLDRFRPLTTAEVGELATSPWARIGGHSHRHRILTRLQDDELRMNLAESRRLLETATGHRVTTMAYPNGDHDARVREAAACAGFERAYTVGSGFVDRASDPFALPRLGVAGVGPDWLLGFQIFRELVRDRRWPLV